MPAVSPARRARLTGRVSPAGALLPGLATLLLLCCAPASAQTPAADASPRRGRSAVTNKQLEPFRQRREAQEEEYERTRRARGLPSREELRRQAEERDRSLFEWARRAEAARREAELAALWAELLTAPRRPYGPDPQPHWATEVYEVSYVSPVFYPYFYAPHARFGRPGHWNFGLRLPGRGWPGRPHAGSPFRHSPFGRRPHAGTLPHVRPPAAIPHRRPR